MKKPRQPRYADIFRPNDEDNGEAEAKRAKASEVWHDTIDWLTENGLLNSRRVDIADRYARAYAEYSVIYPVAASEGPVTKGPNGGDVFNFKWSAVEKLQDRMAKFEDALLISPKAAQDKISGSKPATKKTAADEYLG